jgi:hypothetical protein
VSGACLDPEDGMQWRFSNFLRYAERVTAAPEPVTSVAMSFVSIRYMFSVAAVGLGPVIIFGFVGTLIALMVTGDIVKSTRPPTSAAQMLVGNLVVAPLLETLIMIPLTFSLMAMVKSPRSVALLSGAIWSIPHYLVAGPLGLATAWSFTVLTLCYMSWLTRSLGSAYWYTAGSHALYNTPLTAIVLIFGPKSG